VTTRPLYSSFAWAYDLVVASPGGPDGEAIAAELDRRGIVPPASVVDAGCGSGRYAAALAEAGYAVTGVDRSPDLIAVARGQYAEQPGTGERRREPPARAAVVKRSGTDGYPNPSGRGLAPLFEVRDLRDWTPPAAFDAALCRGVLNDLIDDADRRAAVAGLRGALRAGGVLIADVRDWDASVDHYREHPVFERLVDTERGPLEFRSETTLEPDTRTLRVAERIALSREAEEFDFAMRCWTRAELEATLRDAGFAEVDLDALRPRRRDRIVVVASAR
jgi:SAM-dependent methyltransferase